MLTRWLYFFWSSLILQSLAQQLQNITIQNTAPQIDYTPFVCNVTGSASFSPSCLGGWQVLTSGGETVVSTQGPGPLGADIVPQMFLRFQASALFFTTSASSNATFDIIVSAGSTSVNVSTNSSVGVAAILNLPENETTTLSLTFTAAQIPSHLDIGNITIEVSNNSLLSSILPTQTLPPTVSLPTSTSTGSSTSTPSSTPSAQSSAASQHQQLVADAVGLTLGLGLGLTLVTMLGYFAWKRRRRRQQDDIEWRRTGDTQGQSQRTRTLNFLRTDNRSSTRWF